MLKSDVGLSSVRASSGEDKSGRSRLSIVTFICTSCTYNERDVEQSKQCTEGLGAYHLESGKTNDIRPQDTEKHHKSRFETQKARSINKYASQHKRWVGPRVRLRLRLREKDGNASGNDVASWGKAGVGAPGGWSVVRCLKPCARLGGLFRFVSHHAI